MTRHRSAGSCLPTRGRCLGNQCGTSIDTDDIDFTSPQSNLVYMDKVFSLNDDTSCPFLFHLNTGGINSHCFTSVITTKSPNCCCTPCQLTANSVFTIDRAFVLVEYFNTRPPGNINASQVTVDGFPVDSVDYANGQYVATTANLLSKVQRDRCLDAGLPTKTFFLVSNAGPWDLRARYVLEGTVNTDGVTSCFRAEISNAPNTTNTPLPNAFLSSFAVPDLSLPCSIHGIAPDILFQFNANITMVNPSLVVNCGGRPPRFTGDENDCQQTRCGGSQGGVGECTLSLVTALAIEPTIHTEVTRKTLFCVNACEGLQPCQGSLLEAEEEECNDADLRRPDCQCGNNSSVSPTTDCGCEHHNSRNNVGGWGCNSVGAAEDDVFECECVRVSNQNNNSCGCSNNNSRGCNGWDNSNDNSCGCNNNNSNENNSNHSCRRPRTAFQFNGCNGCSW